jgi:PAS domain S-box-containing protein
MQLELFPQAYGEQKNRQCPFDVHSAYRLLMKEFQEQSDLHKELMEKEYMLRLITDALPVMIGYADTEGRYRFNNKEYEVRYQIPRDEIYGRHILEFTPRSCHRQVLQQIKKVLQGEEVTFEITIEYPVIGERIMYVHHLPHEGADGTIQGFFVLLSDITEQKQSQQKLQQLAWIVESSEDAIVGTTTEGIVTSWNKGAEKLYGYSAAEMIGRYLKGLASPEYRSEINMVIKRIKQGVRVQPYKTVRKKKNGDLVPVSIMVSVIRDEDGGTTGISEFSRDISEQVQAEELFRKAFHVNPSMMSILSFTEQQIIDINENWLKNTGYRKEEVIGHTMHNLNLIVDEASINRVWDAFSQDGVLNNEEIRYKTKSGEIRIGLMSAERLFFSGKMCALVVVTDVTELKHMEEELARLDRLNAIGQMAAGMGHEIRNPMTTVRGFLQTLGNREECQHLTEYFSLMIEELDRANSIIKEFLSFANNKSVDLLEQDLNGIIVSMLPLLEADAILTNKSVGAELAELPLLLLDEQEIRQLILNIVRNGLEAMVPGGHLSIRTYKKENKIVLAIQDRGPGISQEILQKIGTPFVTTKGSGTGLGLAICYSIAARHHAKISVKTGPRGTTFLIQFNSVKETSGKIKKDS